MIYADGDSCGFDLTNIVRPHLCHANRHAVINPKILYGNTTATIVLSIVFSRYIFPETHLLTATKRLETPQEPFWNAHQLLPFARAAIRARWASAAATVGDTKDPGKLEMNECCEPVKEWELKPPSNGMLLR